MAFIYIYNINKLEFDEGLPKILRRYILETSNEISFRGSSNSLIKGSSF